MFLSLDDLLFKFVLFCSFSFLFIIDCNFRNVCKQFSFVLFVVNCATFYLHIYLAFITIIQMGEFFFFLFTFFAEKKDVDAYWLQFSLENILRYNCLDHGTHRYTRTHTHETRFNGQLERTSERANERTTSTLTNRQADEPRNRRTSEPSTNRFWGVFRISS